MTGPISLRAFASVVLFSLFAPVVALLPGSNRVVAQSQGLAKYNVIKSEGRAGQEYELTIMSTKNDCEATKELSDAKLIVPQGVAIKVLVDRSQAPCTLRHR